MTDTTLPSNDSGRLSAIIAYALYLLSIPSAGIFALIGVIVAYVGRDGAGPLARAHLDNGIKIWWVAFWWGLGCAVAALIGFLLAFILIGFPIMWIAAIAAFIVMVWFTIKSLFGLLALLDNRAV